MTSVVAHLRYFEPDNCDRTIRFSPGDRSQVAATPFSRAFVRGMKSVGGSDLCSSSIPAVTEMSSG